MDDAEVRQQVAALEAALDRLPPETGGVVERLLCLYGEAFRRMIAAAATAPDLTAALAHDELVAHLLLLHDVKLEPRQNTDRPFERCDLCSDELADTHPHLLDTSERSVLCACAVCALLFPQRADAAGRYRFIPEAVTAVEDFAFDELTWRALEIPVQIAYFVRSGAAGRVVAYYPSPVGAVESLLPLDAWNDLERGNPSLRALIPDTQALLVNGTGETVEGWIVGIDTCYRLVAVMRTNWRGLRGGEGARAALKGFFAELRTNATPHRTGGSHAIKGAI